MLKNKKSTTPKWTVAMTTRKGELTVLENMTRAETLRLIGPMRNSWWIKGIPYDPWPYKASKEAELIVEASLGPCTAKTLLDSYFDWNGSCSYASDSRMLLDSDISMVRVWTNGKAELYLKPVNFDEMVEEHIHRLGRERIDLLQNLIGWQTQFQGTPWSNRPDFEHGTPNQQTKWRPKGSRGGHHYSVKSGWERYT